MNSPTDDKFKLPLSPMPMRKLKIEAEQGQGMISPIYRGPSPIPFPQVDEGGHEKVQQETGVPVFSLTCDSPPSSAEAVNVWLDAQQKQKTTLVMGEGGQAVNQVRADQANEARDRKVDSSQVLEVHIETVD